MLSMQSLIIVVLLVAGAVGLLIFTFVSQMKKLQETIKSDDEEKVLMEWLRDMKGSVDKSSDTIERKLKDQNQTLEEQLSNQRKSMAEQTKMIWERLEDSSKVIQQVHKELGGISEFGKDMKDLSNILKSPKLRGGLGEQFLYEILENVLPKDLFKTQYRFRNGEICDAVIKTDKGMIPVDSKFPMEKFKDMVVNESQSERDRLKKEFVKQVKKHIDDIANKYILPDEGTTDFAVMYVPSESVYYELIVNSSEVEEHSRLRNIFITSPNTINYQMRAILVAYQQNELQKHAGEILKALSGIKTEAGKFDSDLNLLEKHITNTYKTMDSVKINFSKLFRKIESVQALGEPQEQVLLDEKTENPEEE